MKVAISTDEVTPLVKLAVEYLKEKRYKVSTFGAFRDKKKEWVDSSVELAKAVASGRYDTGVLFCWTGTGSSMAANKVKGIRAALCTDPRQAKGAKKWNHANVLVMSLQVTKPTTARRILDAWFTEPYGKEEFDIRNVRKLNELDRKG